MYFKQEEPRSGGEWLVPSALFLLRIKPFRKTKGARCTNQKSRIGMGSDAVGLLAGGFLFDLFICSFLYFFISKESCAQT